MTCEEWISRLYEILDHDMDETLWKELEHHMRNCQPCLNRFEFEKAIQQRLSKSCAQETCTESVRIRIRAIFEETQD